MARKTKGVAVTRRVRNAVKSGAGAGTQESPPRRENEETGQPLALVLSAGPGQDSKPKAGLQAQGRTPSPRQVSFSFAELQVRQAGNNASSSGSGINTLQLQQ